VSEHDASRLDLFVTEVCNLACPYCFTAGRKRRDPPTERCLAAVDWLMESSSAKVHITFWGGEPLLRLDRLRAIAEHAERLARDRSKRLTLSMPTNATLLDQQALEWIERHGVRIFCSIDGQADGSRPDRRGDSSVPSAVEGLERVVAAGLGHRPTVRMTVTPETAADVADNVVFLARHGAEEILVYPAFDRPWPADGVSRFRSGQRALGRWLVAEISRRDDPTSLPRLQPATTVLRRLREGRRKRRSGRYKHCGAGADLVAVAADGGFFPCHRFVFYGRQQSDAFLMGRLGEPFDPGPSKALRDLRLEDLRGEGRCVECDIYDLCSLGCVAINWATTGETHRAPEWACALMRAQADALRDVHEAAGDDPGLDLYLGLDLGWTVRRTARSLGREAFRLYNSNLRSLGGSHDAEGEGHGEGDGRDDGGDPPPPCP